MVNTTRHSAQGQYGPVQLYTGLIIRLTAVDGAHLAHLHTCTCDLEHYQSKHTGYVWDTHIAGVGRQAGRAGWFNRLCIQRHQQILVSVGNIWSTNTYTYRNILQLLTCRICIETGCKLQNIKKQAYGLKEAT